jgi:hypothetical protein
MLSMLLAGTSSLYAQTTADRRASNHYLLLVETSRTMSQRAHGGSEVVKEILDSSLKGEWRSGDTLEVWRYKESSYTTILPSVRLPLDARSGSKTRLLSALQGQVYDRQVASDKTMPELGRLVHESDFTTLIIVSTGENDLRGTPFDAQINESYHQWQGEQRKLRLPFITVLRAGPGKLAYWSVTPAQWPLELPPFPQELRTVPGKSSKPAAAPGGSAPSIAPQSATASVTNNHLPKPVPDARPISLPPVPFVAIRNEARKPMPSLVPKPVELALADWEPFDEAMKKWPAATFLPAAANVPASGRIAARIETNKPSGSVSAPESKPFKLVLADWEPFDEAMKKWPPAGILLIASNSSQPRVSTTLIETKKLPGLAKAADPKPFELALAGWEPFSEAMKSWPPAKEPPVLSKAALSEAGPPPVATAKPIVTTKSVIPEETKTALLTDTKSQDEPLGAPAALPTANLAEHRAGRDAEAPSYAVSSRGQETVEASTKVIEPEPMAALSGPPEFVAAPAQSFLRENAGALAALFLACVATSFCFLNWLRSYLWPARALPVIPNLAYALRPPPQPKLLGPSHPPRRAPAALRLRPTSP